MFKNTDPENGRTSDILGAYQFPIRFHDFVRAATDVRFFQWGHPHAADSADVFHMQLITKSKDKDGKIDSASFTITNEKSGEAQEIILSLSEKGMISKIKGTETVIHSLPHYFDRTLDLPRTSAFEKANALKMYESNIVSTLLNLTDADETPDRELSVPYRIF